MPRKVIISCAVTGASPTTAKSPYVPVTPAQIADAAIEAGRAGAAVAHIHVRDPETGIASMELELYREVVERIRKSGCNIILNLSGSVANTGIAGQGASSGLAIPGGLVRVNSAGNGRSAPYKPYSLTFADSLNVARGNHFVKTGADVRVIRMATDQQGGITYSFANLDAFLGNTPTTIQYFGDLSEPSPFHNGASGMKHTKQEYYVAFAQDEWHLNPKFTLNYGMRYDYYVPLRERDNRIVKFNIETGQLDPDTTAFLKMRKNNIQPRLSAVWQPAG